MADFGTFGSTGSGSGFISINYAVVGAPEAVASIDEVTAAQDEQAVSSDRLGTSLKRQAVASRETGFAAGVLGRGLGFITKGAKLMGVALGISAIALTVVGFHFEQQMANVAAITGAHGKQLDALRNNAFEASVKTQYSATSAAQAEMLLGRASLKTNQILMAMTPTLNLATAAQGSLSDTAVLMGETLKAFAIPASKAAHVSDVLASATRNGAISMDDLIQSMKFVGAAAYASHQNIDNIVALFKLMAIHGVKGSIAGTTLRYALTRLIKPVKQVQDGLQLINLHATDLYGKNGLKPLPAILDKMYKAMQGIGKVNQGKVLVDVFGVRALSGMSALFNQGPIAWAKAIKAMKDSKGLAAQIAAQMRNTVPVQFKILTHAIEDVTTLLYLHFEPAILGSLKRINGYFGPVISHIDQLQKMISGGYWKGAVYYVDQLTHSGSRLSDIIFTVVNAFVQFWGIVKMAWAVFKPFLIIGLIGAWFAFKGLVIVMQLVNRYGSVLVPIMQTLLGVWLAATIAVKALTIAQAIWNAVTEANPWVLLIYGIALLVLGFIELWKHSKTFRDIIYAIWNFFKNNWQTLAVLIGGPIGVAVVEIIKHWSLVEGIFLNFASDMERIGKGMWDWIAPGLLLVIKGAEHDINAFIKNIKKIVDEYNNLTHGTKKDQVQTKYAETKGGYVDAKGVHHLALFGGASFLGVPQGAQAPQGATASKGDLPPQKVEPNTVPEHNNNNLDRTPIIVQTFLDGKKIAENQAKRKSDKIARGSGADPAGRIGVAAH